MRKTVYSEPAWIVGIMLMSLGTALAEKADFGLSMVVAPAYLLHLKVSESLSLFTFGAAEYMFQATLLMVMALLLRRFKISYLFSFAAALLYGVFLDIFIAVLANVSAHGMVVRAAFFLSSLLITSFSIAMLFNTYLSPEVYELFVKELSTRFGIRLSRFKTVYDCTSLLAAIIMSLAFFGRFRGIGPGTLVCALSTGWLIGRFSAAIERLCIFSDALPLRKYFE